MFATTDPAALTALIDGLGANLMTVDVGPDGVARVSALNRALRAASGFDAARSVGRALGDVLGEEAAHLVAANVKACLEGGRPVDFDAACHMPSGPRWYRITLTPVVGSDLPRLLCVFQDSTDRHISELRARIFADQALMLTDAIEATTCGIAISDPNVAGAPLIYVNGGFTRLTGYSPDEVLGRDARFLDGPATDVATRAAIDAAMAERREITVEVLNYRKDGSTFWNELHLNPVFADDGSLHYWVAVQTDVTQRRLLEGELRNSRELFALAIDGSRDGIFHWDVVADRIWFSDRWRTMLAMEDRVFEGGWAAWSSLIDDPEEMARFHCATQESGTGRRPIDMTMRVRDGHGRVRHLLFRATMVFDESGHALRMVGAQTDVTDMLEAEEALRRSEADYRMLAENGTDIIMRIAADGTILYASPASEHVLGYRPDELVGHSTRTFIAPADRKVFDAASLAMLRSGGGLGTYRAIRKDGAIVWVESNLRVVPGRDCGADEVVAQTRDVTDRMRRDIELKEAHQRLEAQAAALARSEAEARVAMETAEQADRAKSRFLATMSHELRTPLNAILGFSEVIRDAVMGEVGTPIYRDYAGFIHDSGAHLLELINDILDLSKIEAGKRELTPEPIDVPDLVESCVRLVAPRAERAAIRLHASVAPNCPSLMSDLRAMKQILLNLLSNATKFTDEGGQVTIEVGPAAGGCIEFRITDTGIGIPPEHLHKVFEPFHQVDGALARTHDGTGLGLPLVRSLARMLGGEVKLESAVGVGTSVMVYLPARSADVVRLDRAWVGKTA
jgi:PAS domain S-box-containing protein